MMSNIHFYNTKIKNRTTLKTINIRVMVGDFDLRQVDSSVKLYQDFSMLWYKYIYDLDTGEIIAAHEKSDGSYSVHTDILLKSKARDLMECLDVPERREEKLKDLLDEEI